MSGSYPTLQLGPATYQVSAAVTGGQLVMADVSNVGQILPAAAGTKLCLGVALTDAVPVGSGSNLNFATARYETAVAYGPAEVILTVSGSTAVAFGALVGVGAGGTIVPIGALTFDQAVGRCTEPAGIAATGGTGRVRLF
jgi:hypothetical protein